MSKDINRRNFIKSSAVLSAGITILPGSVWSAKTAPSDKLNIALIGAYGRALAHYKGLKNENVVALCDVDKNHLALAAKEFPGAKHYTDWRKCLAQKDIDAVVCCTPDHSHAFIGIWAMNRGYHLYMEKPLGLSVEECRLVRETYLKYKDKIAVQHGTQRHAKPNFDRVRELVRDGSIGELTAVHAWGERQLRRDGYLPAQGTPPDTLDYDLWLGPSPHHPYNPGYFSGEPGLNCLQWNMYWDFGTGQVGDMGSHTMDLAWNAIDAKLPLSAHAYGEKYNSEVTPVELRAAFKLPANDWRGPIDVVWHQGGMMPNSPLHFIDLKGIDHGVLFKGTKGFVVSSFDNRILIPYGDDADLSYFNKRPAEDIIEPMGDFQQEWIDACKGDLKTSCDFVYGGNEMEMMMLGLVSYRAGKEIEYDGKTGRVTNDNAANDFLKRTYRPGWVMNG